MTQLADEIPRVTDEMYRMAQQSASDEAVLSAVRDEHGHVCRLQHQAVVGRVLIHLLWAATLLVAVGMVKESLFAWASRPIEYPPTDAVPLAMPDPPHPEPAVKAPRLVTWEEFEPWTNVVVDSRHKVYDKVIDQAAMIKKLQAQVDGQSRQTTDTFLDQENSINGLRDRCNGMVDRIGRLSQAIHICTGTSTECRRGRR